MRFTRFIKTILCREWRVTNEIPKVAQTDGHDSFGTLAQETSRFAGHLRQSRCPRPSLLLTGFKDASCTG